MSVVLACDLGGTGLRAALVDAAGAIRADHAVPLGLADRPGGVSEADPEDWWRALEAAAAALAAAAPADWAAVEGIGICGMTRTQVFLDPDGRVLRPAMSFRDTRAAEEAEALAGLVPAGHDEAGAVNAFHPLARLAWLGRHEPERAARLGFVVDPKDYLNARLTGIVASDAVSLARLIAAARPGPDGIAPLDRLDLPRRPLPPLLQPQDAVGLVLAGLAGALGTLAGRPVFCLGNDTWAAVAGLGALRPGYAYNISGTTEVFGVVGDRPLAAEGLMTVDWGGGLSQLGGPSQTGADTVAWLTGLLGLGDGPVGAAIDRLLAAPRGDHPVLFLPYLRGERVPHWDPALRGAFLGLDRRHGATDLAWAVIEGVAFLNRIVLERAEAAAGAPVAEIRFGGGGAANAAWCRVKADICGRPVVTGRAAEPGLIGAAMTVWTGLGRHGSLMEAQERLFVPGRRFAPDPGRRAAYDRLYPVFRRAEAAVAPVSHALAALTLPPHVPGAGRCAP